MNKVLALQLKKLRLEAKISQNKLAKEAGVSVAFISKLEAGKYKTISLRVCKQIAKGLHISLHQFLTDVDLMENGDIPNPIIIIKNALRKSGLSLAETKNVADYAEFIISRNKNTKKITKNK